jgi:hypothetical protein
MTIIRPESSRSTAGARPTEADKERTLSMLIDEFPDTDPQSLREMVDTLTAEDALTLRLRMARSSGSNSQAVFKPREANRSAITPVFTSTSDLDEALRVDPSVTEGEQLLAETEEAVEGISHPRNASPVNSEPLIFAHLPASDGEGQKSSKVSPSPRKVSKSTTRASPRNLSTPNRNTPSLKKRIIKARSDESEGEGEDESDGESMTADSPQPSAGMQLSSGSTTSYTLLFNSVEDAMATAFPRAPVTVKKDDFKAVMAKRAEWIGALVDAIKCKTYLEAPALRHIDSGRPTLADEQYSWTTWQMAQEQSIKGYDDLDDLDRIIESKAWVIFEGVLDVHSKGYRLGSISGDPSLKCSTRLQKMIKGIKDISLIKLNAYEDLNVEEYAANPALFVSLSFQFPVSRMLIVN